MCSSDLMKFRPLYDRVVVKRLEAEGKTASGLFLPESAKEKPQQAEVVAVGTGRRLDNGEIRALSVKPGDKVLFGKYSGDEIKLDGEDLIILKEDELLAVIG